MRRVQGRQVPGVLTGDWAGGAGLGPPIRAPSLTGDVGPEEAHEAGG